jgi:hypothetical protein
VKIAIKTTEITLHTSQSGSPKTKFIERVSGKYQGIENAKRIRYKIQTQEGKTFLKELSSGL